jgi:hypothetical protein
MTSITLTDSQEIIELKKEFRELDEMEQWLKHTCCGELETPEMAQVRARKREIATHIFQLETP